MEKTRAKLFLCAALIASSGLARAAGPPPPALPPTPDRTTLEVAPLGPQEGVSLPLQVTMPEFIKANGLSRRPLSWTGNYRDNGGAQVEFHIMSFPGGVR